MPKTIVQIQDSNGNILDTVPYGEVGGQPDANTGAQGFPIYNYTDEQGNKKYTADITQVPSSISLNKDTGNVDISAPQTFFDSEMYQTKIKPVLDTISQNYKLNPDYKYALLGDDENNTKTSEDWVNEIGGELESYVSQAFANEQAKAMEKERSGVSLNDDQLVKMSSVAVEVKDDQGNVIQSVNDNTVQALPTSLKNLNAFKDLQGWDENSHMVTRGNLLDRWNRENVSDEDLLEVYNTVDDYFEKGDFSDADEYAEMTAFAQFLSQQEPERSFWRGVGDVISNEWYNILSGAATFDAGVLDIGEFLADKLIKTPANAVADIFTGKEIGTTYEETGGEMAFISNYLLPTLDDWKEEFQTNAMRLNKVAGAMGSITDQLTPLLIQLAVGNAIGKAVASGVSKVGEYMVTNTGGARVASGITGATAEQLATEAVNGTNLMMKLAKPATANNMLTWAIGVVQGGAKATRVVSSLSDVAAQIVVDVACTDPRLARQFIEGDGSEEEKSYVLEQVAFNVGGWGVAVGGMKLATSFAKTEFGQVLNAMASRQINKWSARIGQYADDIKVKLFHHGDPNFNQTKLEKLQSKTEGLENAEHLRETRLRHNQNQQRAALQRQQVITHRRYQRVAARKSGKLPGITSGAKSWDDLVENARNYKRESDLKYLAAYDVERSNIVYRHDIGIKVAQIKNDLPELSTAINDYVAQLTKVLRTEERAGLGHSSKVMDIAEGGKVAQLNKLSNEYVNGMYRIALGNDTKVKYQEIGKYTGGIDKEVDYYTRFTGDFRTKYPELAAELDVLLARGKKFSAANEDARVFEKVLDEDTLRARRTSGYFDNGYLRTQRLSDWERRQKAGGELEIAELRDDQHLQWGFEGDAPREYQDITFVLFDDLNQVAKQSIRKNQIGYLEQLGEKIDIEVSGEEVKLVKDILPVKQEAISTIENTTRNAVRDIKDDFFDTIFKYQAGRSEVLNAEARAKETGIAADRAKRAAAQLRDRKVKNIIKGNPDVFSAQLLESSFVSKYGKTFEEFSPQDWDKFIENSPKSVKKFLRGKVDESEPVKRVLANELNMLDVPSGDAQIQLIANNNAEILREMDDDLNLSHDLADVLNGVKKPFRYEMPADDDFYNLLMRIGKEQNIGGKFKKHLADMGFEIEKGAHSPFGDIEEYGIDYSLLTQEERQIIYDYFTEPYERRSRLFYNDLDPEDYGDFIPEGKISPGQMRLIDQFEDLKTFIVQNNVNDIWDADNKFIRSLAEETEQEKLAQQAETVHAEALKELDKIRKSTGIADTSILMQDDEQIIRQIDDVIDDIIDTNASDEKLVKTLETFDDSDDVLEYATLKSLTDRPNRKKLLDKLETTASTRYKEEIIVANTVEENGKRVVKINVGEAERMANDWAKQTREMFDTQLDVRFGEVAQRLRDVGSDIVDYDDLFGKIDELNSQITKAAKDDNIVKTYDSMGREEYVRVSPTVAGLITTMPGPLRRSTFGEIQQELVRVFRMGTTGGLVPTSLLRQGVRDPLMAWTMGMTRTSGTVNDELTRVWGSKVADYYQREMPTTWEKILQQAEETGESAETLAARNELARGRVGVEAQQQSRLYDFRAQNRIERNADGIYEESVFTKISDGVEGAYDKTETLNNVRESNIRVNVYNNSYLQALENGHSVPNARRYAEMMQAESITNFQRPVYHLTNLSRTVPYLGAAINGAKSFWRLYALDPVGVTSRIVGGFIIPMISLTALSLRDEENLRVYKQIPEYEKDDNLVFVINGQKFSIPIPQEISNLVRPIQSFVESMHNANDHSFDELMLNSLAGMFPYDLQGFVNIDADRILTDDLTTNPMGVLVQDHLLPGASMLASSMMPPLVKSGVMIATGYDPYTRQPINTGYGYLDRETGEYVVMDYKSGKLAQALGSIFGDNVSPAMAQAIFNNLFGQSNMGTIDGLTDLATAVAEGKPLEGAEAVGSRIGESISKPFTIPTYHEQSVTAWNRAVRQLEAEKTALVNSQEYKTKVDAYNDKYNPLSEKAKNETKSWIDTKQQEFQSKVLKAAQNLVKNYDGGTLDRIKFAAVIRLMTFEPGQDTDINDVLMSEQQSNREQVARTKAIQTMAEMGFSSPNDGSIFGYYKRNNDGTITKDFYSPMAILDFENTQWRQDDVALSNIKVAVRDNDLFTKHDSVSKQIKAIYGDNKKLSKQDYANIEAIQINWNAELAKAVAPYISKMTPEMAINNTNVLNYLYPLVEVPSSYETNKYGKYVSLGDKANKKRAYYESWIKSMFSVNDPYKGQY